MSKEDEIILFFAVLKNKERIALSAHGGVQYTYRTCLIVNIEL